MYSLKSLLDMVATEAAENDSAYRAEQANYRSQHENHEPNSVRFPYRIIQNPDGTLDWAE